VECGWLKRLRETIASLVRAIAPHDAIEAAHKAWILEWIRSGAPLFRIKKPDLPACHLGTYCAVFDPARRKLLLGDHRNAGLWLPPGGHIEPDEDPRVAAARELQEELGIDARPRFETPLFVTVTETVGIDSGHTDVSLWFVFHSDSLSRPQFDDAEFKSLEWYELGSIPFARSHPDMQRFVDKLKRPWCVSGQR